MNRVRIKNERLITLRTILLVVSLLITPQLLAASQPAYETCLSAVRSGQAPFNGQARADIPSAATQSVVYPAQQLATKNDVAAIKSFIEKTRANLGITSDFTADLRPMFSDIDDFNSNYDNENGQFFLIYADSVPMSNNDSDRSENTLVRPLIGTGGFLSIDQNICELKKFYLAENARGTGLGRELLKFIIAQAKSFGYKKMVLQSRKEMKTAIDVYLHFGFTIDSATNDGAVYMSKDISK